MYHLDGTLKHQMMQRLGGDYLCVVMCDKWDENHFLEGELFKWSRVAALQPPQLDVLFSLTFYSM